MYPLSRGTRGVYPLRCDRDASVFFTEIELTLIKPAIFLAKVLSLTLILSLLFGFLVAKKTEFYKRFFEPMFDQTKYVMWLQHNFSTQSLIYLLAEFLISFFLISFAVPFGLVWLLSFITMRIVVRDFTGSDWSLTRKMRASDKHNLRR